MRRPFRLLLSCVSWATLLAALPRRHLRLRRPTGCGTPITSCPTYTPDLGYGFEPITLSSSTLAFTATTVTDQLRELGASWGQMLPRWFKPAIAVVSHAETITVPTNSPTPWPLPRAKFDGLRVALQH